MFIVCMHVHTYAHICVSFKWFLTHHGTLLTLEKSYKLCIWPFLLPLLVVFLDVLVLPFHDSSLPRCVSVGAVEGHVAQAASLFVLFPPACAVGCFHVWLSHANKHLQITMVFIQRGCQRSQTQNMNKFKVSVLVLSHCFQIPMNYSGFFSYFSWLQISLWTYLFISIKSKAWQLFLD